MQRTSGADQLLSDFAVIKDLATRPADSADELARNLGEIYALAFDVDLARYDARHLSAAAPQLLTEIFDLRNWLRDQVPDWQRRGLMTHPVEKNLRDVFRIARYASDMLGELAAGYKRLGDGEITYRGFTGPDHNTLAHRNVDTGQPLAFRSGDAILVRGMHHNSAAIARIGDVDAQFSHLAIVYVDDESRHWVVEALIESGSVVNTLEHFLDHGLGRAIVFRHQDAELAHRAAKLIHDHVRASQTRRGKHIYYDFSMRLDSYKRLFCSKLVRQAYDMASGGRYLLPSFPTRLDMQNVDFFERIGVKAKQTFAPGDIELEPRFDLVAEWQDFRVTSRLRLQDMIMTKLLEWMDVHGYTFREDFAVNMIGVFGRLASRLSESAKDLISDVVPKVPDNMGRRTISTIAMLFRTAQPLLEELEARERESIARTGRPLHARDVLAHLEQVRVASGRRIGYLEMRRRPRVAPAKAAPGGGDGTKPETGPATVVAQ